MPSASTSVVTAASAGGCAAACEATARTVIASEAAIRKRMVDVGCMRPPDGGSLRRGGRSAEKRAEHPGRQRPGTPPIYVPTTTHPRGPLSWEGRSDVLTGILPLSDSISAAACRLASRYFGCKVRGLCRQVRLPETGIDPDDF